MKIFILAQGEGKRWNEETTIPVPCEYKQMLPIQGVPNILRTISMLDGRDYTLVARGEMLSPKQHEITNGHLLTLQWAGNSILDGIKQLLPVDDDVLFLLGDVIFSPRRLQQILSPKGDLYVSGRLGKNRFTGKLAGEIFSLYVQRDYQDKLLNLIHTTQRGSKLWHLDLPFMGLERDWTDDIDSPEEYEQFYDKLNDLAGQN